MEILQILSSIEHNKHYLKRYMRFIENCKSDENSHKERHHICPKTIFPEFKNLKKFKWNELKLTPRQHIIAHIIISKMYPNNFSAFLAIKRMCTSNGIKINSRLYETIRINHAKLLSDRYKGRKGKNKDKIYVFKENDKKLILKSELEYYISEGYLRGQNFSDEQKEKMKKQKNCKLITNDIITKTLKENESTVLEYGWRFGKQKETEETRKKKSISKIGKPGNSRGHIIVINTKTNETLSVLKNDPGLLTGLYAGINKGKKGLFDHLNNTIYECEHCSIKVTKGNYVRWHGDKCKKNNIY